MHDQKLLAALASASLWLLVFALAPTPAFAAPAYEARADTRTASGQRAASGLGDPEELEAFVDHFFAAQMAELNIPGAAIVAAALWLCRRGVGAGGAPPPPAQALPGLGLGPSSVGGRVSLDRGATRGSVVWRARL